MTSDADSPSSAQGSLWSAVKGWLKLLAWLFGVLCFLAGMWWCYCLMENRSGRAAWERTKAELEAKGEKLDWASFVPEPVPDDGNFFRTPLLEAVGYKGNSGGRAYQTIQAFPTFDLARRLADARRGRLSDFDAMADLIRTNLAPGRLFTATDPAAVLVEWYEPMTPIFDELRTAGERPYSQFHQTNAHLKSEVPNFVVARTLCQQLALLSTAHLELGRSDLALAEVRAILAHARGIEGDPILVSLMISLALDDLALNAVWQGLIERQWREEDLVELDRLLGRVDGPAAFQWSIRGERAAVNAAIESGKQSNLAVATPAGGWAGCRRSLEERLTPRGWTWHGLSAVNRLFQSSMEGLYDADARVVETGRLSAVEAELGFLASERSPRMKVAAMAVPNFTGAYQSLTEIQSRIHLCRIAIALERYRLRRDRLPQNLDELVPEFVDRLPQDLIGGGPLNYRPVGGDEFELWSVGWNGVNENAEVSTKRGEGDWVWRSWGVE